MASVDETPFTAAQKPETKGGSKLKRILSWLKLANPYSVAHDTGPGKAEALIVLSHNGTGDLADSTDPSYSNDVSINPSTIPDMLGYAIALLLMSLPECVDPADPVKIMLSVVKEMMIRMKAEVRNNDELALCLKETVNRLLAIERTEGLGIPWVARDSMEKLKRLIQEEMRNLKDLTREWMAVQPLDYEQYYKMVGQVFQNTNDAITSFQVEMAITIQKMASRIPNNNKKASLKSLRPSEKADHRNVREQLRCEECTFGTRVKVLEDITKWANESSSDSPHVFWLTGQAGSGKTTIAYTIARRFERGSSAGQHTVLGGNFLCSRQFEETRGRTQIIPTIAYQLARECKPYEDALQVANNFDVVNHDVVTQLKSLLIAPWQQSEPIRCPKLPPYLIVIDALDEIKGDEGSSFLHDLLAAIDEYDLRGFKFFVTSRSDPEVVKLQGSFASKANCYLQDVPIEEAKPDVKLYLKEKLKELDGRPEFDELVNRAGGLFIYAATAVRYLAGSVTMEEQIGLLRNLFSKSYEPSVSSDTTSLIDDLYRQIMLDAFSNLDERVLARRLCILHTFLYTAERTSASTVVSLVYRRFIPGGDYEAVRAVLQDLHAILYTRGDHIFWYHASFPDFIFTQARSNFRIGERDFAFSYNEPSLHRFLSESCFRIMKLGLRLNMGNIPSSFLFDRDNAIALSKQVDQNIDTAVRYASRYWTHHLATAGLINADDLCDRIAELLQIRILFWIEAMNLMGLRH